MPGARVNDSDAWSDGSMDQPRGSRSNASSAEPVEEDLTNDPAAVAVCAPRRCGVGGIVRSASSPRRLTVAASSTGVARPMRRSSCDSRSSGMPDTVR